MRLEVDNVIFWTGIIWSENEILLSVMFQHPLGGKTFFPLCSTVLDSTPSCKPKVSEMPL